MSTTAVWTRHPSARRAFVMAACGWHKTSLGITDTAEHEDRGIVHLPIDFATRSSRFTDCLKKGPVAGA